MEPEIVAPETVDTEIQSLTPEGYVTCKCCGSIVGYKSSKGKFLYLFAIPLPQIINTIGKQRVNGVISSGWVICGRCRTVFIWDASTALKSD